MIRVKIPGGILSADALDVLGDIAERYAPLGKGHITTRENIQFTTFPFPSARGTPVAGNGGPDQPRGLRHTRSATWWVRPRLEWTPKKSSTQPPYLTGYVRFGVRHPITQAFPRKFKSAFTGIDSRDTRGRCHPGFDLCVPGPGREWCGKAGLQVFVGGGTSIMPRRAKPLYEFLPEEDYLRLALAVWTVSTRPCPCARTV